MKKVYLNTLTPEEIIKRLKDGEVIKLGKTGSLKIKMIDGVIVTKETTTDNFTIGDKFYIDGREDYYFEEQEEFKVEKVGLYKTRDGRTAFVSCIDEYHISGMILYDDYVTKWDLDGTFCGNKDLDLVEYVGD